MPNIQLDQYRLLVDGQPKILRGGEVPYFRLPRSEWKQRLETLKAMGGNFVSSCSPWCIHEPDDGVYDLTGEREERCDLRRFLDLVSEVGLYMLARPGPFMNAEFRTGGVPLWLYQRHPETHSRRADGNLTTGRPCPAEGEASYRQFVRRWYEQVLGLMSQYDASRGGPIILFQPDNELSSAWSYGLLNSLYDPTILGTYWPRWLLDRYGSIEALAARYEQPASTLNPPPPPRGFPSTEGGRKLCLDWMQFKRWFFADWGATLGQWAAELGMTVPLLFNEPVAGFNGHGDHAGFGAELAGRGLRGVTACHTYSDRLMDLAGSVSSLLGVELVKSSPWGGPIISVEANCEWYFPRQSRSNINWPPLARLTLAHGLDGLVVYPVTAARTCPEDTIDGPEYFDPSCIDMAGNLTAAGRLVSDAFQLMEGWEPQLAAARMIPDITLAYTHCMRLADFLGHAPLGRETAVAKGPGGTRFDAEPALAQVTGASHDWLDGYEAVSKQSAPPQGAVWEKLKESAVLLSKLNLAWDMLELTSPNRKPGGGWLLVNCTGTLDSAATSFLLDHLDAGGGCIFAPTLPQFDMNHQADRRLIDRLGVALESTVRPAGGELFDYGGHPLTVEGYGTIQQHGWIFTHRIEGGHGVLAHFENRPVVAKLDAAKVIVAGIDPRFFNPASLALWRKIFVEAADIRQQVRVEGDANAVLRDGTEGGLLFVSDLRGVGGTSTVHVAGRNLSFAVELGLHESRCLPLSVDLGGARLAYATSEITPLEPSVFRITGCPGTAGELAFDAAADLSIDGEPRRTEPDGGRHVVRYTHGLRPSTLRMIAPK